MCATVDSGGIKICKCDDRISGAKNKLMTAGIRVL